MCEMIQICRLFFLFFYFFDYHAQISLCYRMKYVVWDWKVNLVEVSLAEVFHKFFKHFFAIFFSFSFDEV